MVWGSGGLASIIYQLFFSALSPQPPAADSAAPRLAPPPASSGSALDWGCCLQATRLGPTRSFLSLSCGAGQRHGVHQQPTDHTRAGHCLGASSSGPLPLSVQAGGPRPTVDGVEEKVGLNSGPDVSPDHLSPARGQGERRESVGVGTEVGWHC